MKKHSYRILKFILKVIIGTSIFAFIAYLISRIFTITISDSLTITGVLSLAIGIFSLQGNGNMSVGSQYYQAESISSKSILDRTLNNFKARNKSYIFLFYMLIISIILFTIGYMCI